MFAGRKKAAISFALKGVVPVDGRGVSSAVTLTQHLVDLGYECLTLLDTDKPASPQSVANARAAGAIVLEWPDKCSTEERIFLDVPWKVVRALVEYAAECRSRDSVLAITNAKCRKNNFLLDGSAAGARHAERGHAEARRFPANSLLQPGQIEGESTHRS